MHMTLLVVGNDNIEEMMNPFSQDLEMPKYKVRELDEADKQEVLDYYNERGHNYSTFDECYKEHGNDWNFNRFEKDCYGKWCEYSTSNPNMQWDWWEIGGRWPGRLRLKEGGESLGGPNFSWGWPEDEKDEIRNEVPKRCDIARKGDVANLDTLTSYAILIDGEWIEIDGERVAPYLEKVEDETILTCIDYHM